MPSPEETDRLDTAPRHTCHGRHRITVDANDAPVEVNEMTADAGAYVFRHEFRESWYCRDLLGVQDQGRCCRIRQAEVVIR
jgi:hypothetical protein